ncbi:MAG: DUF559 domain-containing protein [Prosthecobacter sp.]|nr:DUF559 domain-containing protein [Prosthecobacter sp.]
MLTRLERIHHEISGERLELIEFARKQRRESTDAEDLLWSCLRDHRVNRRKFRRQHPIEPYILDLLCRTPARHRAGLRPAQQPRRSCAR